MKDTIKRIKCSYATEDELDRLYKILRHDKALITKYLGRENEIRRGERVTLEHALRVLLSLAKKEGLLPLEARTKSTIETIEYR